jgi:transposase
MPHEVRELLVSQRARLVNALRGHLAEVGIIAAQGSNGAYALAAASLEGGSAIPLCVREALAPIIRELQAMTAAVAARGGAAHQRAWGRPDALSGRIRRPIGRTRSKFPQPIAVQERDGRKDTQGFRRANPLGRPSHRVAEDRPRSSIRALRPYFSFGRSPILQ